MGYEISLYFGTQGHDFDSNHSYFQIVGMVDLCKIGDGELSDLNSCRKTGNFPITPNSIKFIQSLNNEGRESPRYIKSSAFCDDPNVRAWEDKYSEPLYSYPAQEILNAIINDNQKEKYRRYEIAIVTLQKFIEEFKNENPRVLLFGH